MNNELNERATCNGKPDKKIKIWKASALFSEEAKENGQDVCLAVLEHSGAVNCVRWSKNGKYLASCSDDKTVMVWDLQPGVGLVFGSTENRENWRPKWILRGHDGGTYACLCNLKHNNINVNALAQTLWI